MEAKVDFRDFFLYGGLLFFELLVLGRQEELDNKLGILEYLLTL